MVNAPAAIHKHMSRLWITSLRVRRFGASWAPLDVILGFYQVSLVVATFLTVSDAFSVVLESSATLCPSACVRLASEPHWLAYARFSRLVGKFDISDTFARLLELFLSPCTCMRMLNIPRQLSSPPFYLHMTLCSL